MLGELLVLGVSHKRTPVELRERLALSEAQIRSLLTGLVSSDDIREAAAISTCNRTEVYLVTGDPVKAEADLLSRLAQRAQIRPTELAGLIFSPRNCDAARHLFKVTGGLDSMVVGEHEVQGQVKRAYELALEVGATGPMLNRLFRASLETGKRVRNETALSRKQTSVASVAVALASQVVGDLAQRKVLVIGAGETAELTAQALAAQGVETIFVSNRRIERARVMADKFGGSVGSLDDLPSQLADADIVVSSTGSPHTILGPSELDQVMAARRERPLVLIDIAVPRDIDPGCGSVEGVSLYDIDDLQSAINRNMAARQSELADAEKIVEQEIHSFARWMGQADVTPTIGALRNKAGQIADQVWAENLGKWQAASSDDLERTELMMRTVIQRLLHEPTLKLKQLAGSEESHAHLEVLTELFDLDLQKESSPQTATHTPVTDLASRRRGGKQ